MVLESCMILLDNSEHMRNGDYIPTRLEAQHDAANFLVGTKTQSNPENTVGVLAMSSSYASEQKPGGAELLVSPTDDVGKILSSLHDVARVQSLNEGIDLTVSIQVAGLALKHRRNKNGAQRIIVFVGSPLGGTVDKKSMAKTGRMLKKNNVSIDVIAMGELEDNQEKLKELVDAANGGANVDAERTCHLVTIPPGVLPSDVLITSPIVRGAVPLVAGAAAAGGRAGAADLDLGGGAFSEFGGVDPNMDPELAMALRVSMEEERARQERLAAAAAAAAAEESKQETTTTMDVEGGGEESKAPATTPIVGEDGEVEVTDEDALLQRALAMSMSDAGPPPPSTQVTTQETGTGIEVQQMMDTEEDDEDAAMQLALQMSMQPDSDIVDASPPTTTSTAPANTSAASAPAGESRQFQDPNFVNQLLGSLPGVDPNDPAIQNALRNLQQTEGEEKDDAKKDDASKKDESK